MPHFILEYSSNLSPELDVAALFKTLHRTAVDTGVFPLGGIRFRARRCDEYLIADGNPNNAFVHLQLRMGHGRPLEVRRETGEKLFAALCEFLDPVYQRRPLAISLEIDEPHPELSYKKNNMHK
jgi:5-carboxymethyl-2-hydroxymuconate isomerase